MNISKENREEEEKERKGVNKTTRREAHWLKVYIFQNNEDKENIMA